MGESLGFRRLSLRGAGMRLRGSGSAGLSVKCER